MVETLINLGGIEIFEQKGGNEIKVEFGVENKWWEWGILNMRIWFLVKVLSGLLEMLKVGRGI